MRENILTYGLGGWVQYGDRAFDVDMRPAQVIRTVCIIYMYLCERNGV